MATVQHFEIPADDVERASRFYREVFGWGVDAHAPDLVFVDPARGGAESTAVGGEIRRRSDHETPTIVITVDDIAVALEAIVRAGGAALGEPETIDDEGRIAYFTDTEGNRIGLWDVRLS